MLVTARLLLAIALAGGIAAASARADSDTRHCADVREGPWDATGPDVADVIALLRIAVGLDVPTENEASRADVAPAEVVGTWHGLPVLRALPDGRIDVRDVVAALRAAVGLHRYSGCYGAPAAGDPTPSSACSAPGNLVSFRGWNVLDPASADPAAELSISLNGLEATVLGWRDDVVTIATPDLSAEPAGAPIDLALSSHAGLTWVPGWIMSRGACEADPAPGALSPSNDATCTGRLTITGADLACVNSARLVGTSTGTVVPLAHLTVESNGSVTADMVWWPNATDVSADLIVACGAREGRLSGALELTHPPLPDLTGMSPTGGSSLGGYPVTLSGEDLDCLGTISVGDSTLLPGVHFFLDSLQRVVVLDWPAAPVRVLDSESTVVARDRRGGVDATPLTFQYVGTGLPTCASMAPRSGPLAGGTLVTIGGSGMSAVTGVRFGNTPAPSFWRPSYEFIIATTPAATSVGSVPVTLVASEGYEVTCSLLFDYVP